MRAPADRVSRALRAALAFDCVAAGTLPWLPGEARGYEYVHAGFAFLAAALLVLEALVPRQLPRLPLDPALTLASIVLVAHTAYMWLDEGDDVLAFRGTLFSLGGAITALALMAQRQNQVRVEQARGVGRP